MKIPFVFDHDLRVLTLNGQVEDRVNKSIDNLMPMVLPMANYGEA